MGPRFAVVAVAKRAIKLALLPAAYVRRERQPGLFVLIYHRVGADMDQEMDLPTARFREHLLLLRREFDVVRLVEGLERLGRGDLQRDLVAVTFDDGYADVYRRAWPLLAELRIPATLFLATGFLDGAERAPISRHVRGRGEAALPLSWDEVRAMVDSGLVDVGSHSVTHPDFDRIGEERAERELVASKAAIADRLGREPQVFAYPHAIVGHADIVGRHYAWAVGGERGKNVVGQLDRARIERTPVRRTDGTFFLRRRLAGIAPLEDRLYARLRSRPAESGEPTRR